jgi:hypothetical protein
MASQAIGDEVGDSWRADGRLSSVATRSYGTCTSPTKPQRRATVR